MSLPKLFALNLLLLASGVPSTWSSGGDDLTLTVSMPLSRPTEPETYLCAPVSLETISSDGNGSSSSLYVTGFETLADERVAHHVILFGCRHPGEGGLAAALAFL